MALIIVRGIMHIRTKRQLNGCYLKSCPTVKPTEKGVVSMYNDFKEFLPKNVHPNDLGFTHYFKNLLRYTKK